MKNPIIIICMLFYSVLQAQGIRFESVTWNELKEKAGKEHKLIFVDAYTTWCGPCKSMAKNTFTDKAVAEYYNASFINAKIDMEKGEGPGLGKLYEVMCYPNLLFIDAEGKLVHRAAGLMQPVDFIALGKAAQNTGHTFSSLQDKYMSGNYDHGFLVDYLNYLSNNCLPAGDIAIKHLANVEKSKLPDHENWQILNEFVTDVHSEPFTYFLENRGVFARQYGDSSVNTKIYDSFLNAARDQLYARNADSVIAQMRMNIGRLHFAREEELLLSIDDAHSYMQQNWPHYFETARILIDKFRGSDPDYLNNVAWAIFEHGTDKEHLETAEGWAKKSVELKEGSANLDTYACLLNRNGKKQQAIEVEKKAIALGKSKNEDTADLEKTLKGFQAKK